MKLESLESIARALTDANVRYLIVGGLAVAARAGRRIRKIFGNCDYCVEI
jgi:hypothetical protein